jgi:adenylate cyclase class IV
MDAPVGPRDELELKAVVPDPAGLVARLETAGAVAGFRGLMTDRRYDREGELAARDEVLRVRTYRHLDGGSEAQLGWKGPTRRSADGYKVRAELECDLARGGGDPGALLQALGYRVVHAIDRRVAVYALHGAAARLEWYPRMDVLVEVEGTGEAIEAVVRATGLDRATFAADPLRAFVAHYEAGGDRAAPRRAVLALAELAGEAPTWGP